MTLNELAKKLEDMYLNAPKGEQVTMIHLFGIKYNKQIKEYGVSEVVEQSGIHKSYITEVAKMIKLAKYVVPI